MIGLFASAPRRTFRCLPFPTIKVYLKFKILNKLCIQSQVQAQKRLRVFHGVTRRHFQLTMSRPDPSIGFLFPLSPRAPDEKISPSDWLSQFTLCLAPIVVHIFIGVPVAVYLHRKEPRWHDMIGFYNPTTIIWRYMAIAERRARAKQWKAIDMAATNARFWDGEKWDGSQSMMEKSRYKVFVAFRLTRFGATHRVTTE